jgi:N-acetylmuramoyl-L-alanine amidase
MEKIYLIDSGHGGMLNGAYQTAPDKMFNFGNGTIAYEGVTNRIVKDYVLKYGVQSGLKLIDVCPSVLDLPLEIRADFSNSLSRKYGANNCLLISLHSNAGKGTGFEIFTTKGETLSDKYATLFFQRFKEKFPLVALRTDYVSDNDPDKEAEFYIQRKTICPSILLEWLFFDNWNDYQIIRNELEQMKYAKFIIDYCLEVNKLQV